MARVAAQLTNFTAGELSPRLDGSNDLSKYPAGCKTLENMVVFHMEQQLVDRELNLYLK